MPETLSVAIAGFGAIGRAVAGAFSEADGIPGLRLAAIGARDPAKVQAALPPGLPVPPAIVGITDLATLADIVIECTPAALWLAATVALAAPATVRAASATRLRVVPASDLAALDPVWTTAPVFRNHGYMVFDTLYGTDAELRIQPQMAAGHGVKNDGKQWTITLRESLRFHDCEPVLARDAVASIRRFGARDSYSTSLTIPRSGILQASDIARRT